IYVAWEDYRTPGVSRVMFDLSLDGGLTWGGGQDAKVFFNTADFALDAADRTALDAFAAMLTANPQLVVTVSGFTDTVGNNADNQTLSVNRAQAVANYLINTRGIAADRVSQASFGEGRLAVATADGVANEANRRVELTVDRVIYTGNVNVFRDQFGGGLGLDNTDETNSPPGQGDYEIPAQPDRGVWMGLSIDVDRSGGANDGRVYVAFADQGDLDGQPDAAAINAADHHDLDVFVIASDNRGAAWNALSAAPVKVNDDTGTASQFFSWLDVDQSTGNLAIAWYDARNDDGAFGPADNDGVTNTDVQFFASISFDGGATWGDNIQVSDGTSNASPLADGIHYGDYTGLAFDNNIVHMAWADNSPAQFGDTEVFYDRIGLANSTLDDLLGDVNRALASANLDERIVAVLDGQRIALRALDGVTTFDLSADTGSTAISQLGFRAGQTAELAFGQLSADATFNLSVNGGPARAVTIPRANTDGSAPGTNGNATVDNLVDDINAALGTAGFSAQIQAIADGQKVVLVGLAGVTGFSLTAGASNTAVTEIGFGASQSAASVSGGLRITATNPVDGVLRLKAATPVSGFVGRLSGDAVFQVSLSGVNGGNPKTVTVSQAATSSNRNILDVVADVQNALDDAGFEGKVNVSSLGKKLVFSTLQPGATGFQITAAAGTPAVTELGLAPSKAGSGADIVITTRDGVVHQIALDGLTTIGQVISAIETQTGNDVDVELSDGATRLKLIDRSGGSIATFKVENALGSRAAVDTTDVDSDGNTTEIFIRPNTAALDLGILGADTTNAAADPPDGEFEGGQLGGVEPLDRIFIRNAQAGASLQISTPQLNLAGQIADTDGDGSTTDGLNAALRFG
ncbi:MAG: OmpA family protein, partial [Burkholderiales bacterium]